MTIKNALWFSFDNKYSTDFGIINVNVDSGMMEENFLANKQINEETIRGKEKPYHQDIQREPIVLNLNFAFEDKWDTDKIREVARWLDVNYYKELFFSNDVNRIFYAMPVDEARLIHNGLSQGYISLTMRTNSPYSYSPVYIDEYDLSTNLTTTNITFENLGDTDLYPELWIQKIGAGDISIVNNTNGGQEFKFTNLADQEEVYIDNENSIIITDIVDTYRYDNFNNNYLKLLKYSVNNLTVTGTAILKLRYQFRTLG